MVFGLVVKHWISKIIVAVRRVQMFTIILHYIIFFCCTTTGRYRGGWKKKTVFDCDDTGPFKNSRYDFILLDRMTFDEQWFFVFFVQTFQYVNFIQKIFPKIWREFFIIPLYKVWCIQLSSHCKNSQTIPKLFESNYY